MKKHVITASLVLSAVLLSGCAGSAGAATTSASPSPGTPVSPSSRAATVLDYYPIRENVRYVYEGTGNEFASFSVYLDYATGTRMQQRIENGATVTASVVEVADGKVTCLASRGEAYARENLLDAADGGGEVLLMEPIASGTSWKLSDGSTRTITGVSVDVDTPAGGFSSVRVTTVGADGETTDYYADGVGLVKWVSTGEGYEVSSSLSELQQDAAYPATVRFYYPNLNENKLYYKDKTLSFKTNDVTRKVLEDAYKEPVSDDVGLVFTEKVKINSFYLNGDGMVYLDLGKEFVTGMNAGSGYEAMVLQCVANTFGTYYGADKVVLTIDGGAYESGHIRLDKGDYLTVSTQGSIEIT